MIEEHNRNDAAKICLSGPLKVAESVPTNYPWKVVFVLLRKRLLIWFLTLVAEQRNGTPNKVLCGPKRLMGRLTDYADRADAAQAPSRAAAHYSIVFQLSHDLPVLEDGP
jgi:hypothetical protein